MYNFQNVLTTSFHKDNGKTFIVVLQNIINFHFSVLVFYLQSFIINLWYLDLNIEFRGTTYVFIDIKSASKCNIGSIFKMSNNEENIINPGNLLSLWSILPLLKGVDHKDRR